MSQYMDEMARRRDTVIECVDGDRVLGFMDVEDYRTPDVNTGFVPYDIVVSLSEGVGEAPAAVRDLLEDKGADFERVHFVKGNKSDLEGEYLAGIKLLEAESISSAR